MRTCRYIRRNGGCGSSRRVSPTSRSSRSAPRRPSSWYSRMLDSRFCVVLRTAGERTAELAEQLLREQCETLHVLRVAPFAEAVRQCYRIAIESGAPWLLTCDADVLVAPDMADQVQRIAQRMPGSAWQAIGYDADKLAGCARLGGLRPHRASELAGLSDRIADSARPEADPCSLRPK